MTDDTNEANAEPPRRELNCDQVAWLMQALAGLEAIAEKQSLPHFLKESAKTGCLLEIFDILDLGFEDQAAAINALPGWRIKRAVHGPDAVNIATRREDWDYEMERRADMARDMGDDDD